MRAGHFNVKISVPLVAIRLASYFDNETFSQPHASYPIAELFEYKRNECLTFSYMSFFVSLTEKDMNIIHLQWRAV